MIIDVHNHIGVSGDGVEATPDELLAMLDTAGIDRTVVFPIDDKAPGQVYPDMNDRVLDFQRRHPDRIVGFCRVNPKGGPAAVEELRRCIGNGLRGVKLHPRSDQFAPDDARDVLQAARALGAPVIIHSEKEGTSHPRLWTPILAEFPELRIVLGHGGKSAYWELPELLKDLPHVKVETSCLSYFRSGYLVKHLGVERIVYGSDYPYMHPLLETQKIRLLLPDEADRETVFYRNPCWFLGRGS